MKRLWSMFLLVATLMVMFTTGTAYAASTTTTIEDYDNVDVFVNNQRVDADVYVDENNIAWVSSYSELRLIFPDETRDLNFPAVEEPSSLKNWCTMFNYDLRVTDRAVYLSNEDTPITIPENITLYVNNVKINNVTAYFEDDYVWLTSYSDVFQVFPEETKNMYLPTVNEPTRLDDWANEFDYEMEVRGFSVYLTKEFSTIEPEPTTEPKPTTGSTFDPNLTVEPEPTVIPEPVPAPILQPTTTTQPVPQPTTTTQPTTETPITIPENVKIYVNAMLINNVFANLDSSGKAFVSSYTELKKIFPNETKYLSFPAVMEPVELKEWAENFGYSYIQKDYRIYLSNTNVTPIEIYLNSAIINFPDQQPIVINNRTMIPIRAVTESLGWNVTWGENVVTITNGSHTLILYIGKTFYTIDSVRKTMDVAPQVINNRTLVPIRFLGEALGYNVDYDGSGSVKIVTLTK